MRVRAVSARKVAATAAADIATITASVAIAPVATPVTVAAVALTTAASACGPQYTQWEWLLARQCSVRAVSLNWHWQCEPDPYTEKSTGCQWHWLVGTCPKLALPGVFWSQSGASPSGQCTLALMEQQALDVERIRQYPGRMQVERRVKLKVPGKHFPALTPAEQKES